MLALAVGGRGFAAGDRRADLYYLIVGGLGSEPKYQEQFDNEVKDLAAVARRTTGDSRVVVLTWRGCAMSAVEKMLGSERAKVKATDTLAADPRRPRQLRRRSLQAEPCRPRHRRRRVPEAARGGARALAADRQHDERERRDARELGRRRPHADHRDAQQFERNATHLADHWAKALATARPTSIRMA